MSNQIAISLQFPQLVNFFLVNLNLLIFQQLTFHCRSEKKPNKKLKANIQTYKQVQTLLLEVKF